MSDAPKLVCFVTPAPLANAPRVCWQADALQAIGYRLHVVHGGVPALGPGSRWPCTAVPGKSSALVKLRQALARRLLPFAPFATAEVALRVHAGNFHALADAAVAVDAHYYIGSRVDGIAAAARAAELTRAKFGADLDTAREAAPPDHADDPVLRSAERIILATLLPRATHLTAATTEIAAAFATRFGSRPEIARDAPCNDAAEAGQAVLGRLVKHAVGRP